MHKPSSNGFTLVELVTVVMILGALLGTAVPRFVDLGCQARDAVIEHTASGIRAGALMVYIKAATMNQTGAFGSVPFDGGLIYTNYGYPNAADVYHKLVTDPSQYTAFSVGSFETQFRLTNSPDPANCKVTYVAPSSPGNTASITTVTSGCCD